MYPDLLWKVAEKMEGEIAAEIRVMLGESQLAQSLFTDEQKQRRIESMKLVAGLHESWMKMHLDGGWVYGPNFDPAKNEHPNLLPWDKLPATVKSKAKIFEIIAKAFAELEAVTTFTANGATTQP